MKAVPKKKKFSMALARSLGLSPQEISIFRKLDTPIRIQDFLDRLAINWEKKGETNMSPRRTIESKKAHCMEGGFLAAAALWLHGEKPLLLDLKTPGEAGHIVALYKRNGYWGVISKTNHVALRFRDPVYRNIRELVMSYFHECTNDRTGKKVLRFYAGPFDMRRWGKGWVTAKENLKDIVHEITHAKEVSLFPKKSEIHIRRADAMELKAGRMTEWKKSDKRT